MKELLTDKQAAKIRQLDPSIDTEGMSKTEARLLIGRYMNSQPCSEAQRATLIKHGYEEYQTDAMGFSDANRAIRLIYSQPCSAAQARLIGDLGYPPVFEKLTMGEAKDFLKKATQFEILSAKSARALSGLGVAAKDMLTMTEAQAVAKAGELTIQRMTEGKPAPIAKADLAGSLFDDEGVSNG